MCSFLGLPALIHAIIDQKRVSGGIDPLYILK